MSIHNCKLIELPKISDTRGNLTIIENNYHIPFKMERVYYLYDIPGGATRGGHAHKKLEQLVIAASGSFDIIIDNGQEKKTIHLNRSYFGLYICPMIWREIKNFSTNSICLVVASLPYDETDYYRDYDQFLLTARNKK